MEIYILYIYIYIYIYISGVFRGFQTLVYWFRHPNYVPKLKKNHYGLSNIKISSLFIGIGIPQRSPHIWNQEHSLPN